MLVNIYRLDIFNGGFPVSGMIVGDFPHDNKWYLRVFGSTLGGFLSSVLRGASGPPRRRSALEKVVERLDNGGTLW
jgi:hypothetical protein